MARQSPYQIVLSTEERRMLTARAAKYTRPYFEVLRAKMILLAAEGWSNDAIARSLRTRREVVSLWRKRFFEQRLAGLEDQGRSGRPRAFPPRGRRHRQSARL
jgi:Winged helix-turn helix